MFLTYWNLYTTYRIDSGDIKKSLKLFNERAAWFSQDTWATNVTLHLDTMHIP